MTIRRHAKTAAALVLATAVIYLIAGFVLLPALVRTEVEDYVRRELDHRLEIRRVVFNPVTFNASIHGLNLREADGGELLRFERLDVGLAFRSALEGALILSRLSLNRPSVYVELRHGGTLNFARLIAALSAGEDDGGPMPRLRVERIRLVQGELQFADLPSGKRARLDLMPLDLELQELSTLPSESGTYALTARTALGEALTWSGTGGLNPVQASGRIVLSGWKAATLARFLGRHLQVEAPRGEASLSANYRIDYADGSLSGRIDDIQVALADLAVRTPGAKQSLLTLRSLLFADGEVDVGAQQVTFGTSRVDDLQLDLRNGLESTGGQAPAPGNQTSPPDPPAAAPSPEPNTSSAAGDAPWQLALPGLQLEGVSLAFPVNGGDAAIADIVARAAVHATHGAKTSRLEIREASLTTGGIRVERGAESVRLDRVQVDFPDAWISVGEKQEAALKRLQLQLAAVSAQQAGGQSQVDSVILEIESAAVSSARSDAATQGSPLDSHFGGLRLEIANAGLRRAGESLSGTRIELRAARGTVGSRPDRPDSRRTSLSEVMLDARGLAATRAQTGGVQIATASVAARSFALGADGTVEGLQIGLIDIGVRSEVDQVQLSKASVSARRAAFATAPLAAAGSTGSRAPDLARFAALALRVTGIESKPAGGKSGRTTLATAAVDVEALSLRQVPEALAPGAGLGLSGNGLKLVLERFETVHDLGMLRIGSAALGLDRFESPAGTPRRPGTQLVALGGLRIDAQALAERRARAKVDSVDLSRLTLASNSAQLALGPGLEDLVLAGASAQLAQGVVRHPINGRELARLARAELAGVSLGLAGRQLDIGRALLAGGSATAVIDPKGALDWEAFIAEFGAKGKPASATPKTGGRDAWKVHVKSAEVTRSAASLVDQRYQPALAVGLNDIALRAGNLSTAGTLSGQIELSANIVSGGRIQATGQVNVGSPSADLKVALSDISLKPLQPFLAEYAHLEIASADASANGRLRYGLQGSTGANLLYEGSLGLSKILIEETAPRRALIAAESISAPDVRLTLGPGQLDIAEVALIGLDTRLSIAEDQTVNFAQVLKPRPAAETSNEASPAFQASIARIRIEKSRLAFADFSLRPQFAVQVHDLKGVAAGASSDPDVRSRLALEGRVDQFGFARIQGELKLLAPTAFADIAMTFRNLELTALSPYSAKFAGYRLASGKLSLDLKYQLENKRLVGQNRIVLDKLELGERVESPDALDLPLELAIALLKDDRGRIDIGLPVTGNLDDPKFDIGALIGKAIGNLITGIVTAPFKMLAALFGRGTEEIDRIDFDPGSARLLPPEREKLQAVASALGKRPQLALNVKPGVAAAEDAHAIRLRALRGEVYAAMGSKLGPDEEPGPINFGSPTVQRAIEALYAERFGLPELRDRRAAFARSIAPEPSAESGDATNRLAAERSELMYRGLFEHLVGAATVPEEAIAALGRERGEAIARELVAAGSVAATRVSATAPVPAGDASPNAVPTKLELVITK